MVEPEWDEHTRSLMEGRAQYEAERHSDGCGLHPAILERPDLYKFTFEDTHCPACAKVAAYARHQAEQDERADKHLKNAPAQIARAGDGRHTRLRLMTADEQSALSRGAGRGVRGG